MPRFLVVPPLSALVLVAPLAVFAQNPGGSVVTRTPNMVTEWVADPATVQFNFLHRFTESGPPQHQISNAPTFMVAAGLPWRVTSGFAYSTSSDVAPGRPNEWEFFGRVMPFAPGNAFADVTLHLGRNVGAASTDGEVALARGFGALRLLGAARYFSNAYRAGDRRTSLGGGVNVRLLHWLAVGGDANSLTSRRPGERIAWSGGALIGIPTTPHSFSIHATNAITGTLEGVSRGTRHTRWGFEYTVPITLARYFGAFRPKTRPADAVAQAPDSASTAAPVPSAAPATTTPAATTAATPTPVAPTPTPAEPMRVTKDAPASTAPTASAASVPNATAPDATVPNASAPTASAPRPAASRAPSAAPARRDTVRAQMRNLEYAPARIEVAVGTTVVWTNNAPLVHTIVADDGTFNSGNIDVGKRWSHTFTKPGTYAFHCTPHPFMKGVVVVR